MTDSVFHKIFLITCTGFRLCQRHQTAVLHLNLWKLPHIRYSPAKHHVSEVHLIGYASYLIKKSNLSSKLISRSKKLTSEQASWIFLKNYLGILRPGSNCSQVWHHMFPVAFVAGWLQGHWWGFISRNYVVWPTFFLMNVFIALKGSHFWFYISLHCSWCCAVWRP